MNPPDAELLGRLLNRHGAALVLFARQWCSTPEDAVQEAFMKLAAQAQCPDDPAAWLYRVVRNGAISAGRSESRRRKHEAAAAMCAADWFVQPAEAAIDIQTVTAALQQLPPEDREGIIAHLWGGLTFAQIAELVASSNSTVHRRYQSGLNALRNLLKQSVR